MIDLRNLKLEKLIFELRYLKGLTYLDKSGKVMNTIIDKYPEFKNFSVGNINDGVSLVAYNPEIVVNFRFDRIVVHIDYPNKDEFENYYEICDYAINIISEGFDISTFTRIGNRFIYFYPLEDVQEVNSIILEKGPFRVNRDKLLHVGTEFTQPEFKIVVSNDDISHIIKLASISSRKKAIEKRPLKVDQSEFAENGIQIDIDFFTKKEMDRSGLVCGELMRQNQRNIRKLIQTIFNAEKE